MFGPESGAKGWSGLPIVYDRVRISDHARASDYLAIWESERCKMVEMSCEIHDKYAANSQFITHLMGRILSKQARHSLALANAIEEAGCCLCVSFVNCVRVQKVCPVVVVHLGCDVLYCQTNGRTTYALITLTAIWPYC